MPAITGILLAAGSSRRFGADKLMQFLPEGDRLAVRAYRNLAAGVDKVLAVVRPESGELAACLAAAGAEVVVCRDAALGMANSLACGVEAARDAAGWLVALADMPKVRPATVAAVAESVRGGALIAAPHWQGQRGHPVGFGRALGQELMSLSGDRGAKGVIEQNLGRVQLLNCGDSGVLQDIDWPEDLARLKMGTNG